MAKKFKFRVETVLKLRWQRERSAMRKLADGRARAAEIENSIRALQGQLRHQDQLVRRGVLTGTVDVQYMGLYRRHVMALHRKIIDQAGQLQAVAAELQQLRAELMEAMKRRKTLSTLKDKLKSRYDLQARRDEQNEMDEISTTRYGHLQLCGGSE